MNIFAMLSKRRICRTAAQITAVPYKRTDAVISGYFGYGNSGDDTSLSCLVSAIRGEYHGANIAVLCHDPQDFGKWCGIRGIGRYDVMRMISALRESRLLISGGGSLFQNATSIRSLIYYVSVIALAKLCGAKVVICANGIGPLKGRLAEKIVKKTAESAYHISVRDPASKEFLEKLGIPPHRIAVTADPAFRLVLADVGRRKYTRRIYGMKENAKYFAVSLRAFACKNDEGFRDVCRACRDIYLRFGLIPVFVSMQESEDGELCRRIAAETCGEAVTVPYLAGDDLCRLISETEFVLSMRLHLMIYAAAAGVPSVGISVDPKLDAVSSILGNCGTVAISELCGDKLYGAVSEALSADREALAAVAWSQARLTGEDVSRIVGIMKEK